MAATMQTGTHASLQVKWVDKNGQAAKVDGQTSWESVDPLMLEVTVNQADSTAATLYAPGPVGSTQVHATADADMGEGIKTITATLDVTVITGEAVGGEITFLPEAAIPVGGAPAPVPAA